jgi:predicted dehydrogenase
VSVLKLGLIGCGDLVQLVHLNALASLADVTVTALADLDPQRRNAAHRRVPSAIPCACYEDVLALPDVEAVLICAPSGLHAEIARAALRLGKHVYLEKPLAVTLDEGRGVMEVWRQAGVVGMIGFNYRFHPLVQALQRELRSGRLGKLVSVRSVFSTAPSTLPDWRRSRRSGGGALLELASHHVDLFRFLFEQEVHEVYADLRSQESEEDSAMLQLRLANGLLAQSFFSLRSVEEDRIEIYGRQGKLTLDRHRSLRVAFSGVRERHARFALLRESIRTLTRHAYPRKKLRAPHYEPSYKAALAHFVGAVREHHQARPDFSDGYRSLAIILAAEESARTGRVVLLKAFDEDLTHQ